MGLRNGRAGGGMDNVPKLEIEGSIWNSNRVYYIHLCENTTRKNMNLYSSPTDCFIVQQTGLFWLV